MRIDNLKTGLARGAGPTAVITPAFQTFAQTCGFSVDPCRARTGSDKGKVERSGRTERRTFADLLQTNWPSLEQFQAALDARAADVHAQRRSPLTGTTITEALFAEPALPQPVPPVHELFDCGGAACLPGLFSVL